MHLKNPKRLTILENVIDIFIPDTKNKNLKTLCPTRWLERHEV